MDTLEQEIAGVLPPELIRGVAYDPLQRSFYPTVITPPRYRDVAPLTVVEVRSAEDVGLCLEAANRIGTPIYVRQGTGQVSIELLNPFPPGSVVLDLRRLTHFAPNVADGFVEVGASITLEQSNRELGPMGYGYPLAVQYVTWGGLVSINLSGHLVDALSGKPGDYVLGLEVVLPTGEIIKTGSRSIRKVVGPDLTHLFIGNQGLLGVITGLRLRLVPKRNEQAYGWIAFDEVDELLAHVQAIYAERLSLPVICEMVESKFNEVSGLRKHLPSGHILLLGTEGESEGQARDKMDRLISATGRRPTRSAVVEDRAEWDRIWAIRESPHHHIPGEYLIGETVDIPLSRLSEAVGAVLQLRAEALEAWPGLQGYVWGHIGSGSVHPAYACPPDWPTERRVPIARWLRERILRIKLAVEASVGEQGIFPGHQPWFVATYGPTSLRVLEAVKKALDPNNILNPDRMVPHPMIVDDPQ